MTLAKLELRDLSLLLQIAAVFLVVLLFGVGLPRWLSLLLGVLVAGFLIQPSFTDTGRASFARVWEDLSKTDETPGNTTQLVFSVLEDMRVTEHRIKRRSADGKANPGGAIVLVDQSPDGAQLLLVDPNGIFHEVRVGQQGEISSTRLEQIKAPINRLAYEKGVDKPYQFLRTTDLMLLPAEDPSSRRLLVSHLQWDASNDCITLNLSEGRVDLSALDQSVEWQTRFSSTPCYPSSMGMTNENGGRLEQLPNGNLLLTVGINVNNDWAQDDTASYGKILELNPSTWEVGVFSKGHRNPQGLLVDGETIWSTEHGPDGGDELNILTRDGNYGWPTSTYGLSYGKRTAYSGASVGSRPGEHDGDIKPLYAWVPSIGISRLIRLNGEGFELWGDDLLVGSLSGNGSGRSFYRVRVRDDVIRTIERIEIGRKARDMQQLADGRIVNWDGTYHIQVFEPASHVFSKCNSCHAVNQGFVANGIGPDLYGIVGQSVASVPGFNYSQSLSQLGGRWSEERLHWFLEDPMGRVPGTTMAMPGITDPNERQQIIDHLKGVDRR